MIARGAADDDGPLRSAREGVRETGDLHRTVHRLGPAVGEEDPRLWHGRERGEPFGERLGRGVAEPLEEVERVQLPQLCRDRLDDLLAAVSDRAVPQACHPVEVATAGVVRDVRALAGDDPQERPRGRRRTRERVQQRPRPRRFLHRGM